MFQVGQKVKIKYSSIPRYIGQEATVTGSSETGDWTEVELGEDTKWEFKTKHLELIVTGYDWYISARYGRREEAQDLGIALMALGHRVTSQWIWRDQPSDYNDATDDEVASYAQEDMDDVLRATHFISLSEVETNPYGRGGRHVESGIALSRLMPWSVIGPRENIFHFMKHVTHFESAKDFLEVVKEGF